MRVVACALAIALVVVGSTKGAAGQAATAKRSPGAGPVIVFDTVKGSFEVETYPNEAPKTVALILSLVKRNYYNGLRVHRFEPGFVVQWGDPQTRDMTKKADWGTRAAASRLACQRSARSVPMSEVLWARPGPGTRGPPTVRFMS